MVSVAPTAQEISDEDLAVVGKLANWAGLQEADCKNLAALFGFGENEFTSMHVRILLAVPEPTFRSEVEKWSVNSQPASVRQKAMAFALYDAAVAVGRPPPVAAAPTTPTGTTPDVAKAILALAAAQKPSERNVKASSVLNPSDSSDVPLATKDLMDDWYEHYRLVRHGEPLPDKEPTPDQISAMHSRVVILGLDPYGDFSILTPHGRRMAKLLRHRAWLPQEDGSYRPVDVPGPESFDTWETCWKVYEVILLMLRFTDATGAKTMVATPSALEMYYEYFAQLSKEHPQCWFLCQRAEDRCRAELFPRLARRLEVKLGFQPTWSAVFEAAALEDRFWDQEVRRPALRFIAQGGGRAVASLTTAAEQSIAEKAAQIQGDGDSKHAKRRKTAAAKASAKAAARATTAPQDRGGGGGAGNGKGRGKGKGSEKHPRKDGKGRYYTNNDGRELCYKFANSPKGRNACGPSCSANRVHQCQLCLGIHVNADCGTMQ